MRFDTRACDPPYKKDDEAPVATIAKTETTFSTDDGLEVSGAVKAFKLYVVTEDDNEKGSNTVTITRP